MATISLYRSKVNNMPSLIKELKNSVTDFKSALANLKTKSLQVNQSICNLDDVINTISTSTKTQEEKVTALETFEQNCEQFISEAASVDSNVAEVVNQRKDDFYSKYTYLRPKTHEEGFLESLWSGAKAVLKSVHEWCKSNWKSLVVRIAIGIGAILIGALVVAGCTLLIGATAGVAISTFWGAVVAGLKAAVLSAIIAAGTDAVITIAISLISGKDVVTVLAQTASAVLDGFTRGFMLGGIMAGVSQIFSGIFKIASKYFPTGRNGGKTVGDYLRIFSPNHIRSSAGGTIIKIGSKYKNIRFDVDVYQLFHMNIQLAKKTNYHFPLGIVLTGLWGGSLNKLLSDFWDRLLGYIGFRGNNK